MLSLHCMCMTHRFASAGGKCASEALSADTTGMFSERFYNVWTCVWLFRWNFPTLKAAAIKTVGTPHTRHHLHQLQRQCFCLFQSIWDLRCCKIMWLSLSHMHHSVNSLSSFALANMKKCRTVLKRTGLQLSPSWCHKGHWDLSHGDPTLLRVFKWTFTPSESCGCHVCLLINAERSKAASFSLSS